VEDPYLEGEDPYLEGEDPSLVEALLLMAFHRLGMVVDRILAFVEAFVEA
jgi:hypothetical protein